MVFPSRHCSRDNGGYVPGVRFCPRRKTKRVIVWTLKLSTSPRRTAQTTKTRCVAPNRIAQHDDNEQQQQRQERATTTGHNILTQLVMEPNNDHECESVLRTSEQNESTAERKRKCRQPSSRTNSLLTGGHGPSVDSRSPCFSSCFL